MSNINLTSAAAVATEGLKVVEVRFDAHNSAQGYFYLAKPDSGVNVGDFVMVPTGKHHITKVEGRSEQYANHVKLTRVIGVHEVDVIDVHASYDPKFIFGKLDIEDQAELTEQLDAVAEHLRNGQKRNHQQQVLAMLGVDKPMKLGELPVANNLLEE